MRPSPPLLRELYLCVCVRVCVVFDVSVTMKLSSIDLLTESCTGTFHTSTTSPSSFASSGLRCRSDGGAGSGPINQSRHPALERRCLGEGCAKVAASSSLLMGAVLTAVLLMVCALPVVSPSRDVPDPSAKRLHYDLMSPYNALVKPSGGPNHQLTVKMGLRLSQVLNVVSTAGWSGREEGVYPVCVSPPPACVCLYACPFVCLSVCM